MRQAHDALVEIIDAAQTILPKLTGDPPNEEQQGWNLFDFDNSGMLHIEKDDAAPIFQSDADAVAHVRLLAENGDQKARHAIELHDLNQPKIDQLRAARQRAVADIA